MTQPIDSPLLPTPPESEKEPPLPKNAPERYYLTMALAGAIYPVLFFLLATIFLGDGAIRLGEIICSCCFGALLGAAGGMAALAVGMAIRVILKVPCDNVRFFTFASGLMGLFALVPLLFGGNYPADQLPWGRGTYYFLLGPGLITPLAQLAGGWSEWRVSGPPAPPEPWRFGIRQVLAVTLFVAIALTFLKLLGVLTPWLFVWTSVWLAYQWCTMELVLQFIRWRLGSDLDAGVRG